MNKEDSMKKVNLRPLGSRVVVRLIEEVAEDGGIILPEEAKKDQGFKRGEVVAVGDSEKVRVKKGQKVLLGGFTGTEIEMGDERYVVVKSKEILALIE
jgi:chaperonin GroES